jgi:hypothetical protein
MVKYICAAFALLTFGQMALGNKELKYPVSAIPDSLKVNAKAVIRNHEQVFEIKSIGNGVESVTYAITILNENGLDYAVFHQGYDKLTRISGIKGTVYNALGEKIEQLTADKVIDHSSISGYSLYEDNRVKYFEPKTMTFPFTVEYSYVREYNGLLAYPSWDPVMDYNVSLLTSVFNVICPNSLSFRFKENNIKGNVNMNKNDINCTYTWIIQNLPAIEEEPFCASAYDYFPTVIIAPDNFEIEGYQGNCSTWESFGKWSLEILKNRDVLGEETQLIIQQLVKNYTTDYDKAKAIYEYMQNKTRYVSIQEGLGGWQPIDAETVNRLGYGDCKALSNYMKTLLSAAGIKSYYTRISAGEYPDIFYSGFPSNQFNHVILCVPLTQDTIWLECTSQHLPFGYIGTFTDDRDALVITEDGGKLIHTRMYTASDNQIERTVNVLLDVSGNASLSTIARYSGVLYDDKLYFYLAGTEDKKKMILDEINLPGAVLKKFEYQDIRAEVPAIDERLEIEVPRYATLSGVRMLVSLVPTGRQRVVPKKTINRKSDVVIRRSTVTCDTVRINIPEGYAKESIPGEIKIKSKFGTYSLQTVPREDKVIGIRKLELKKCKYSPTDYPDLIDFYKKIATADNTKISLKKAGI